MAIELSSTQDIIDGEEATVWYILNREKKINLNESLNKSIIECSLVENIRWLGNAPQETYIYVSYSEWDSTELVALMNVHGQVLRSGMYSIEEIVSEQELFIVIMSGFGMGDDALQFSLDEDDIKYAVLDPIGRFVIPPEYNHITFDDEDNIFIAEKKGDDYNFNLDGERI